MDTAALLMAKMRGEGSSTSQVPERPVDPGTQAVWERMKGESPSSRKVLAEHRENDRQAQQAFNARVAKRAQELLNRHEGGHFPEEAARQQIRQEDAAAAREAEKRDAYDRMVASNRAEMEANSTEALRGRIKAATEERRKDSFRQVLEDIVTQALKKTASA